MAPREIFELVGLLMLLGILVAVGARTADAMQSRMSRLVR